VIVCEAWRITGPPASAEQAPGKPAVAADEAGEAGESAKAGEPAKAEAGSGDAGAGKAGNPQVFHLSAGRRSSKCRPGRGRRPG
jgi:hypothetical protein